MRLAGYQFTAFIFLLGAALVRAEEPGVLFEVFLAVADGMGENPFVIRLRKWPLVKQAAPLAENVLMRKAVGAVVPCNAHPLRISHR